METKNLTFFNSIQKKQIKLKVNLVNSMYLNNETVFRIFEIEVTLLEQFL